MSHRIIFLEVIDSESVCGVLFNELNHSPFAQVRGKTLRVTNFGYSFNISTFKVHICIF